MREENHDQDDTQTVDLYLSESFSFRVVTPVTITCVVAEATYSGSISWDAD